MPQTIQRRLHCLRKLEVWGWWPLHEDGYHWHSQDSWSHWLANQSWLLWRMLAHPWVYPGGSARPKLLRVDASCHHTKYLNRGVAVPLPGTWAFSWMSLHLAPSDYLDQPNPLQQLEELWANKLLWNPQMSFKLSEYLLMKLRRT